MDIEYVGQILAAVLTKYCNGVAEIPVPDRSGTGGVVIKRVDDDLLLTSVADEVEALSVMEHFQPPATTSGTTSSRNAATTDTQGVTTT